MAVYPKGNKFMASVGAGADRIRKTFRTEGEAQAWEEEQGGLREASKALPEAPPSAPIGWSVQKAFDETLKHQWRGTPAMDKTLVNARQVLAFFGPDTPVQAISADRVLEWMEECQEEGNSTSTCNRKLSALSVMLARAADFGGLQAIPRIKRYKEGQHRIRWFTEEEEIQMVTMARHLGMYGLADLIIIGVDTGFRRGEMLGFRLADYREGLLVLHAGSTKSGWSRSVPATVRVREILESRRLEGCQVLAPGLSEGILTRQWAILRTTLGRDEDPGFIVHVLRHTCATRLVARGNPLNVVQAWMGHQVIATTMRYAHLVPGALTAAAKTLEKETV